MKSKHDITSFIVDWFAENTIKTKGELLGNLGADYLHYGWIDSFKFISFISAAEKEFGIIFTSDDYRDETFSTIQGLIDMIGTKIAMKKKVMARKVIVIVGGSLKKDDRGRWRTTSFGEGDENGALGDRLRVLAGAMLYKEEPSQKIIALGGRGQLAKFPDAPAVADIIKKELIECDVAASDIITETESGNTFQQLQALKKILRDNDFQRVRIISNTYHLPRIEALIERDPELKRMLDNEHIELRSAEEVLIEREPERKDEIDRIYASRGMQERIKKEQQGVSQLKEGTYKLQ